MNMTPYQEFIFVSRYARWIESEGRRETWSECVDRYLDFMFKGIDEPETKAELRSAIFNLDVLPSMRAMATAGPALERDNAAGFNCTYLVVDSMTSFDEAMYCLLCGCGVGFSVERKYIAKLPEVPALYPTDTVISVRDSKIGWCKGLKELIGLLYSGSVPTWDLSKVRPEGSPLKTFGGRASGPKPLDDLFNFVVKTFTEAQGRKLNDLECHDIMCMIGRVVQCGGVRRSALISLSDLGSERLKSAKFGEWYNENVQRAMSNNSAVFEEKPTVLEFMHFWESLYTSKSGERGIFNRDAAKKVVKKNERRDPSFDFGCNPCSEIILRPSQMCNLSEAVIRPEDTAQSIERKVRLATILGTLQSRLTNFRYLGKKWQRNCEEERLLGVSLTGIMDNPITYAPSVQVVERWRSTAIETNKAWAEKLGIPQSTAITTIKPSGTVSQLAMCSSGIHPQYSEYYIRTVRVDNMDPVAKHLIERGVPHETDLTNSNVTVFSFPVKSPKGSLIRDKISAIGQLELWLFYQNFWCEHKPSITVYVREDEWLEVGAWVYKHFDAMSGVSFLPYSDHTYAQAPYQPISEKEFLSLGSTPDLQFDKLVEHIDNTTSAQEYACVGGACDL